MIEEHELFIIAVMLLLMLVLAFAYGAMWGMHVSERLAGNFRRTAYECTTQLLDENAELRAALRGSTYREQANP